VPRFANAARIHLVETSQRLREVQKQTLGNAATYHSSLDTLPSGPSLVIANEFFDALPIRQFELRQGRWMERCVGLSASGALQIGLVPSAETFAYIDESAVVEVSAQRDAVASQIGAKLASAPGAALIIDYGHVASAAGDTFQAVSQHRYCGVLDYP